MGLRAPFGYVGYEYTMAELFCSILDKLCAHCHTNSDYQSGCASCPAGILLFECREYVLNAMLEDEHHQHYISEEWIQRRRELGYPEQTEAERQRETEVIEDYKPECDVLRAMQKAIKGIIPHPFFYVQYSKKRAYERPRRLVRFMELAGRFTELELKRMTR